MDAAAKRRQDLKGRILDGVEKDFLVLQAQCVRQFGPAAGIFARQLFFWDGKGETPGGWIYKTQKEWTEETGLSTRQQNKARRILIRKGMMEEDLRPNPRNAFRPQLYYRLDLEALSGALGISSPIGISDRSSPTGISDRSNPTDTTVRTSESTTNRSSNECVTTERANTESTPESSAESLQRVAAGESALQAAENRGFPATGEGEIEEAEGVERTTDHTSNSSTRPISISGDAGRGRPSDEPPARPDSLELSRINKMLTDGEKHPKCYGVYRAYTQGKLEFERVVEAVCYKLTGGFSDAERYREAVERIHRLLQEEEGLA